MVQRRESHFGFSVAESVAMGRLPHPVDRERDRRIAAHFLRAAELISVENLRSIHRQDLRVLALPDSGVPLIGPVGP